MSEQESEGTQQDGDDGEKVDTGGENASSPDDGEAEGGGGGE